MRFRSWGNREDYDLQEKMRSRSRGRSKSYDPQNEIENRYFVVRVEHSLINVVNRSNNWDEIRFSYEQLISDKGK